MENYNNTKGQTIFLSVVGIATLLVAIVGATFAWFSATVTGNEKASSVIVQTATLGITYTDGQEISLTNATPGQSARKSFTIAPAGDVDMDQNYSIYWNITEFDFIEKGDLVYALEGAVEDSKGSAATGSHGTAVNQSTTAVPTTLNQDVKIGETGGTIKPGEVHKYGLTLTFKYTDSDQNSNQGKKFNGIIKVKADPISTGGE